MKILRHLPKTCTTEFSSMLT